MKRAVMIAVLLLAMLTACNMPADIVPEPASQQTPTLAPTPELTPEPTPEPTPTPEPVNLDRAIPVFMYHAVSDNVWGIEGLFVRPSNMAAQLEYLRDNGYTTVTFECFPLLPDIEKPVMLTFDDGYRCNYEELFPLLQQYIQKATIFLIANSIGDDIFLTREQIGRMHASGLVSFQAHTATHSNLTTLNADRQRQEHSDSNDIISALTGNAPIALAYPFGRNNDTVSAIASEYYVYLLTTEHGRWREQAGPLDIPRLRVSRGTTLNGFIDLLG